MNRRAPTHLKPLFALSAFALSLALVIGCAGPPERMDRWRPSEGPSEVPDLDTGSLPSTSPPPADRPLIESRNSLASVPFQGGTLDLDRVMASVELHFPELIAAQQEIERAEGLLLEAEGGFDPILSGKGTFERGFYETEDLNLRIDQPIPLGGATVFGGYRIGRGNFASYDGDIITNDAGEFYLGAILPILRNSAVDERRAAVWRARIQRDAAEPLVQEKRIGVARKAALSYWKWVAAGQKLEVARGLLALAEGRQAGFKEALAKGDISEVVAADNERLVMQRRGFVVSALRNLERATLGLSIYLRDENGDPLRVSPESIPKEFPEPPPLRLDELDAHIIFGLRHRPELARLGAARAQNRLDLELGENLLLPEFNVNVFGAQDVGGSSSPKEELDPLKYGFGISLKVPLQRRKARGKVRQARAKLAKVGQKIRLQGDKIEAEVRDASSSFHRARERVILERRDLALAIRVEAGEREALAAGESDLLRLNLREQATARSRSKLIDAQATCLAALADYRAALGLPRPDIE